MPDPTPDGMTFKQISQLRKDSGKEIAAILNRFTDQTNFIVVSLKSRVRGRAPGRYYTVALKVRIPHSDGLREAKNV